MQLKDSQSKNMDYLFYLAGYSDRSFFAEADPS